MDIENDRPTTIDANFAARCISFAYGRPETTADTWVSLSLADRLTILRADRAGIFDGARKSTWNIAGLLLAFRLGYLNRMASNRRGTAINAANLAAARKGRETAEKVIDGKPE